MLYHTFLCSIYCHPKPCLSWPFHFSFTTSHLTFSFFNINPLSPTQIFIPPQSFILSLIHWLIYLQHLHCFFIAISHLFTICFLFSTLTLTICIHVHIPSIFTILFLISITISYHSPFISILSHYLLPASMYVLLALQPSSTSYA